MSDSNYTPPSTPESNPGWTAVPPTAPPAGSYPPPGQYPPQGQYPPAGAYPPGQYPPPGAYPPATASGLSSSTAAGLSYLTFIPAVIFLVLDPYKRDPFVRFHAFQEIALTVASIAVSIVFHFIPFIGWLVGSLVQLVLFVFWLIAMIKAFSGQRWKVPVLGDLAENFARSV